MRNFGCVRRQYDRLVATLASEVARGAETSSRPFYEWAAGEVLLDAAMLIEAHEEDLSSVGVNDFLRTIYDSFEQMGEYMLVPALTFDKLRRPIVVVVPRPSL